MPPTTDPADHRDAAAEAARPDASAMPCATCRLRQRAQRKPRSFLGLLWRLHARICPGWKAYQRTLASQPASSG